jgi:AcrR family transcriptional regulator
MFTEPLSVSVRHQYPALMVVLDSVADTLIRAASDILKTEGPAGLTVRRIAASAGVSTMNVYSRFGGKEGVVDQLYMEGFRRLGAAVVEATSNDNVLDSIRAACFAYRNFALDNPTLYSVMFDRPVPDFEPSVEATGVADATLELLVGRLTRARDAGLIDTANPFHVAAIVWATCHGAISLEMKEVGPPEIDWGLIYGHAIEILLQGLA